MSAKVVVGNDLSLTSLEQADNVDGAPPSAAAACEAPVPEGMGQCTVDASYTRRARGTANRPLWQGNLNVYWLFGTAVGLWFLFIYAPGHVSILQPPSDGTTTCTVYQKFNAQHGGTCSTFCALYGMKCSNGWDDTSNTCTKNSGKAAIGCNSQDNGSSDHICSCAPVAVAAPAGDVCQKIAADPAFGSNELKKCDAVSAAKTAPLVVHLASVYLVYLICMWNCYHTPSHGPHYCTAHVWLGRLAVLVLGPLGFLSGLYLSWNPQYSMARGLAIGLTSGGAAQMLASAIGYFSIWKWRKVGAGGDGTEAEKEKQREFWMMVHMCGMIAVFLPSCGTPALMRLAGSLGVPLGISLGVFVSVMSLLVRPMQQAIANKKML
jgi:hypothetical protein